LKYAGWGRSENSLYKVPIMLRTKRRLQILAGFVALLLSAAGLGCKGFFVNPTLTTITVDPPTPTIQVGQQPLQMTAIGTYDDGSSNAPANLFWASSPASVATITSSGLLSAVGVGSATVTASSANVTGTTTVTVALPNVTSIKLTPSNTSIAQNGSQSYTAAATVSGQMNPVDITGTATWTITVGASPGGAAVPNGLFTLSNTGTAEVITPQSGAFPALPYVVTVNATYPGNGSTTITGTGELTITMQ
jgi:Bacterial Ig-like domain (group 2)